MDDDCCAVCAEPLEWTGYGLCGHLQTCSKCVARLRFLMKDKRCTICQQESDIVVFTRYMGDYTEKLTQEKFHSLQGGVGFRYLSAINGYFDDVSQYNTIKALCSYTHPEVDSSDGAPQKFPNLKLLKAHVKDRLGKSFCEICLRGRKVFVCEQLLYSPQEIKMHLSKGDLHGPLAEGGFKGHPMCEFCRTRFFSDSELFKHNSEKHEVCFLCRRDRPQVYRYYRDYSELEDHFRNEHFPCMHPHCIESRFVVFRTEAELKQHSMLDHERPEGSRSQRREAAMIETNFQYRRPPTRERGRGRFQLDARQEYAPSSAVDDSSAGVADPNGYPEHRVVQLTDADFPSFNDAPSSVMPNQWPVRGSRSGTRLRESSFPSLPGQGGQQVTQAPQKRGDTLAARIAANRSPIQSRPAPQPLSNPNLKPLRNVESMPQLHQADANEKTAPPNWPHRKQKEPETKPATNAWVTLSKKDDDRGRGEEFPSLSGDSTAGIGGAGGRAKWGRSLEKPKPEPPPKPKAAMPSVSDLSLFPSLGGAATGPPSRKKSPSAPQPQAKVSEGIKAANKALIKKIKNQMDNDTFQEFHRNADFFLKDGISVEVFHDRLVKHGLAHYISEIASLCPFTSKRSELFAIHAQFVNQCTQNPDHAPVFVPVSVLEQSYKDAMDHPCWICQRCATLNLPSADFCEACDASNRLNPTPAVYRRNQGNPRTLFGVNDRDSKANVWGRQKKL